MNQATSGDYLPTDLKVVAEARKGTPETKDEIIGALITLVIELKGRGESQRYCSNVAAKAGKIADKHHAHGMAIGFSNSRYALEHLIVDLIDPEDIGPGMSQKYLHSDIIGKERF